MARMKVARTMLHAAAAVGIATFGMGTASAQATGNSMGGMQMSSGSKMNMNGRKAAPKKAMHHKKRMRHKAAVKAK